MFGREPEGRPVQRGGQHGGDGRRGDGGRGVHVHDEFKGAGGFGGGVLSTG